MGSGRRRSWRGKTTVRTAWQPSRTGLPTRRLPELTSGTPPKQPTQTPPATADRQDHPAERRCHRRNTAAHGGPPREHRGQQRNATPTGNATGHPQRCRHELNPTGTSNATDHRQRRRQGLNPTVTGNATDHPQRCPHGLNPTAIRNARPTGGTPQPPATPQVISATPLWAELRGHRQLHGHQPRAAVTTTPRPPHDHWRKA